MKVNKNQYKWFIRYWSGGYWQEHYYLTEEQARFAKALTPESELYQDESGTRLFIDENNVIKKAYNQHGCDIGLFWYYVIFNFSVENNNDTKRN